MEGGLGGRGPSAQGFMRLYSLPRRPSSHAAAMVRNAPGLPEYSVIRPELGLSCLMLLS